MMQDAINELKKGKTVSIKGEGYSFYQQEIAPSAMSKEQYETLMRMSEQHFRILEKIASCKDNGNPINGGDFIDFLENEYQQKGDNLL